MGKDSFLHMRTTEELKGALENAARADHRSVASLVEKVLSEWLNQHGFLGQSEARKGRERRA